MVRVMEITSLNWEYDIFPIRLCGVVYKYIMLVDHTIIRSHNVKRHLVNRWSPKSLQVQRRK